MSNFYGLHIENKLSWRTHIDYLCKIISRNIGIINRLKLYLPQHILFSLYTTLISSYINYGILAWGNAAQTILNRLFLLQKKALRIITTSSFIAHTDPLFFHNKILKVKDLYNYYLGIFMFQLTHNEIPYSLATIFSRNINVHSFLFNSSSLPLSHTIYSYSSCPEINQVWWTEIIELS